MRATTIHAPLDGDFSK